MTTRALMLILVGGPALMAAPAPASVKPCRDKAGRVVECPTVRKPSPRCKDGAGRFVSCTEAKSSRAADKTSIK